MAVSEKDERIIQHAIAALTLDGPDMGVALERCKILYSGILIMSLGRCKTDDEKINLIKCYVGSSKEILAHLEIEAKKIAKGSAPLQPTP